MGRFVVHSHEDLFAFNESNIIIMQCSVTCFSQLTWKSNLKCQEENTVGFRGQFTVSPPGFQKGRVTYVQNGAHFAWRRVARAQVRASEALRLLGRGVWGQAPELETRNLKKNKKFSFNIYSDFLLTQSYFHWLGSWVRPEVEGHCWQRQGAVQKGRAVAYEDRAWHPAILH